VDTITTIESKLEAQKQSDAAEARRLEEAKRRLQVEAKSRADDERHKCGVEGLQQD
jgi:hypothetical protein